MLITVDYNNDRNDNIGTNDLQVSLLRKKNRTNVHYFSRVFFSFLVLIFFRKNPIQCF